MIKSSQLKHCVKQSIKRAQEDQTGYDYVIPSAALGASAVAGKGAYDFGRLQRVTGDIDKELANLRSKLIPDINNIQETVDPHLGHKVPLNVDQAEEALTAYNKAMRKLTKQKLLGVPVGKLYKGSVMYQDAIHGQLPEAYNKLKASKFNPLVAAELIKELKSKVSLRGEDPSSYFHHMISFTDPAATKHTLRGHAISQVLADHMTAPLLPNNAGVRKMLEDAAAANNLQPALEEMIKEPGRYGFLSKDHARRLAGEFTHRLSIDNKPAADILNYLSGQKALSEPFRQYLSGGSPDTLAQRIDYIKNHGPALGMHDPAYVDSVIKTMKRGLLGGPAWRTKNTDVGKVLSMLGNDVNVMGQGKAYSLVTGNVSRLGKYGLLGAALPLGAYGGTALYDRLKKNRMIKQSSSRPVLVKKSEEGESSLRDMVPFAVAAPAAAYAAANITTPRDIAVTYGTMSRNYGGANITSGHKNPADAIKEILADKKLAPWYSKFFPVTDDIARGAGGLLNSPIKNPNLLIDTGFGALNQPSAAEVSTPRFLHSVEKIRPLSVMSYLTDIAPSSMRHAGATTIADSRIYGNVLREVLGYGPNIKEFMTEAKRRAPKTMKKVKLKYLGDSYTPAVLQSAIDNAGIPKEQAKILNEIADYYAGVHPDYPLKVTQPEIAARLRAAANKKLAVISGSSRGDFVAERARQLSSSRAKFGLSPNEVEIIGQFGDAINDPLTHKITEGHDVVKLGRMPNKLYTGLQSIADMHSASLGASAAAEAAIMEAPISAASNWGKWYGTRPDRKTIAGQTYRRAIATDAAQMIKDYGLDSDYKTKRLFAQALRKAPGRLGEFTGRLVSGDTVGLSSREAKLIDIIHSRLGAVERKAFADKLGNLIDSGDMHGLADRVVPVADWNEGNVQRMLKLKGTMDWDPDKIMALLKDDKALAEMKAQSKLRGADELQRIKDSRKALSEAVYSRALKNYLKGKGKMLGAAGLAAGLTGYGINRLAHKSDREEDREPLTRHNILHKLKDRIHQTF